jgi:hypothetical protein
MKRQLWPEERIAELNKLTAAGLTASQVAMRLGITRNAVCGRWNREGLLRAVPRPTPRPVLRPKPKPKPKPAPIMRPTVPVPDVAPVSLDVDIMALTSTTCKWPINDGNPYRFCGAEKPVEDGPYCPYHAKVASAGMPVRRRR